MEEKIEVLGVQLDCLTAKETMLSAMQFMENDSVDTIEIMTMDDLMNNQENEVWKAQTDELKIVLPGEAEILEAADIRDRIKLKETENRTFLKMFMKYLQKNQKRVYVLAEMEEDVNATGNMSVRACMSES